MKKKILLIGMGGTIASEVGPDGLAPELSPEELVAYVPEISELCDVDFLMLFSIDSTDIQPIHWLECAKTIEKEYENYDGFVISHGTDTLAYTAAVLSYLIQNADKPIILTGAQKPINFENTDSKVNLSDSFLAATSSTIHGVHIVFNGDIIAGTRARKTSSKSFRAFSSINYPLIANIQDGYLLQYVFNDINGPPVFYNKINEKIGLLKLIPTTQPDVLEYLLKQNDALIIESYGVGGIPTGRSFHDLVEEYTQKGKFVIMTTQVQNEGSDLGVYQVGHSLKGRKNVLEAYDMSNESVMAKIMWILGKTTNTDEVRELFYTPIANDIIRGK